MRNTRERQVKKAMSQESIMKEKEKTPTCMRNGT
jgi:hypothetical protein